MKLNFENNLKGGLKFDVAGATHSIAKIWNKTHSVIFFALLIVSVALGWAVWRGDIIEEGSWSDQKKQDFLDTQNTGVTFKEKEFNMVVERIRARKEENASALQPIKDIFKPY